MARLALLLASLCVTLLVAECAVRLGYARSDGFVQTRAAQRWFARHWGPVNRFGWRDAEVDLARLAATRRLFVLGDSFAAGHGIERRSDRFADRLADRLGPGWSLVVMADLGWQTGDELEALRRFPLRPTLLVLSHAPNDIEDAAARHGLRFDYGIGRPPPRLAWLVEGSDLANLLYWRWVRFGQREKLERYWSFVREAYARPEVWEDHAASLRALAQLAREAGATLVAVVFPNLPDVAGSRDLTARVAALLRGEGASVLDLGEELAARDPRSLIVGPLDPHPSAGLHAEVAERLAERLAPAVGVPRAPGIP
jgi:hypothetical protein